MGYPALRGLRIDWAPDFQAQVFEAWQSVMVPGLTLENPFPVYPVGHSAWAEKTWF